MKYSPLIVVLLVAIVSVTSHRMLGTAQTPAGKLYRQMTAAEKSEFISAESRRIARELSGNEYLFTPDFEMRIQKAVDQYATRVDAKESKRELRLVFGRGQAQAPTLIAAFKARNVSPLIGIYIPWIESEFINYDSPNSMGSVGMFQFIPQTGEKFGLSRQDLLDVAKSADAAARYITKNVETFKHDPMKEALALLAYNRGEKRLTSDLKLLVNDQNQQCSICALAAGGSQLDATFQNESIYYVPRFFAAAIVGENPHVFGMPGQPLSSHGAAH